MLDEPGLIQSVLDRRINLGLGLGLEHDILLGNAMWTGLLAAAGTVAVAKGAAYRADAIVNAVGAVAGGGWCGPHTAICHPTTWAAIHTERDTSARPLDVASMVDGQVSQWVLSKSVTVGKAIVGDLFSAVALFTRGPLEMSLSREHGDFLLKSQVAMMLSFRAFPWIRQPAAVAIVTGL
jgi:HK97 family phage major capsid protein